MIQLSSRRAWLKIASVLLPLQAMGLAIRASGIPNPETREALAPIPDSFPTQPAELVRETVTVAHFDLQRIKELVDARPSLARAAWDWGFGDWETALGAASHMGNRPIAAYLLSKGARPDIFTAAMLGHLEVVKAFVSAQPHVQSIQGPHGISLLAHAKAGGEASRPVFEYLQSLGDAGATEPAALSESEAASILGVYPFGVAGTQTIEVTADRSQVAWTRKGAMGRMLFHLGGRVFYPGGAPAVRIGFSEEDGGMTMTVHDPDVVLKIHRRAESK
jgi:hypothetical protein